MIKDLTLIFHLSPYHFSYLIINSEKNYITNNKTYAISDTKESTITKQLDNIIQKDILLQVKYKKTLGGLDLGHQTLIPDILFDQEKIQEYCNLTNKSEDEYKSFSKLKFTPCYSVFKIKNKTHRKLQNYFENLTIKHSGAILIDYGMYLHTKNKKNFFVYVDRYYFHIIMIKNKQLVLYNKYEFKTINDFTYYLLNCINVLEINMEDISLNIMTNIDISDPIFDTISKYIQRINFISHPQDFTYSNETEHQSEHKQHNLLSQLICE